MEASVFKNENFQAIVQAGYSLAEYISDVEVDNFDLDGGFFIEGGRQWSLPLSDKLDLRSTISLRFQFAELEYLGDNNTLEQETDYFREHLFHMTDPQKAVEIIDRFVGEAERSWKER